jgi:hypothetical protein
VKRSPTATIAFDGKDNEIYSTINIVSTFQNTDVKQKICDECRAIGAELPKYELMGTTLRVHFKALKRALIDQPKAPKCR